MYDELKSWTTKSLEEELERRKQQKNPPPLLEEPNIEAIEKFVISYVKHVGEIGYEPQDAKYFAYEVLLRAYYGTAIFGWLNQVLKG